MVHTIQAHCSCDARPTTVAKDANLQPCLTPVFDYICGLATALAIQLDDNKPLNLRRYSLQNGEYIEL